MANYNGLKSSINNNIYENQTQQITGTVLNAILNEMVTTLGAGYQFAGVAYVGMTPSEPDGRIFYLAGEGIYTSFDGIQVPQGKLGILKWDSRWHLETIDGLGGGANLTGYVTVASTDDLPDEGVATLGYLCGTNLYLYVGEGGDTKEGKYQDCGSFRGPQGDSVQDVEQTQTSHENGGVNKIKFTLSNGQAYEFQVRNGTTSTGLFPTLADLQAAYPSPVVGQYAFVGSGFPADIYVCTTAGTWTDSGEDYDGDNVDLTDYATKAEVSALDLKVTDLEEGETVLQQQINAIQPVIIEGNVTNAPDNEDITATPDNRLKFANRSATITNKGYKILRTDASFADQVTDINTAYEIRYKFELESDEVVTIPSGCELHFNGGSIVGGTINLNGAILSGDVLITSEPDWDKEDEFYEAYKPNNLLIPVSWFGAKGDGVTDDAPAIIRSIKWLHKSGSKLLFDITGTYILGDGIEDLVNDPDKKLHTGYSYDPNSAVMTGDWASVDGSGVSRRDYIAQHAANIGRKIDLEFFRFNNLVIDGNGSTLKSHANNGYCRHNGIFRFYGCEDFVLKNIWIDANKEERPYVQNNYQTDYSFGTIVTSYNDIINYDSLYSIEQIENMWAGGVGTRDVSCGYRDVSNITLKFCRSFVIENVRSTGSLLDGLRITATGGYVSDSFIVKNCIFEHAGRGNFNGAGMTNGRFENCTFQYAGLLKDKETVAKASSGVHNVDLENEDLVAINKLLVFERCSFYKTYQLGFVFNFNTRECTLDGCYFHETGVRMVVNSGGFANEVRRCYFFNGACDISQEGSNIHDNIFLFKDVLRSFGSNSTGEYDGQFLYGETNQNKISVVPSRFCNNVIKFEWTEEPTITAPLLTGRYNLIMNDNVFCDMPNGSLNAINASMKEFKGNRIVNDTTAYPWITTGFTVNPFYQLDTPIDIEIPKNSSPYGGYFSTLEGTGLLKYRIYRTVSGASSTLWLFLPFLHCRGRVVAENKSVLFEAGVTGGGWNRYGYIKHNEQSNLDVTGYFYSSFAGFYLKLTSTGICSIEVEGEPTNAYRNTVCNDIVLSTAPSISGFVAFQVVNNIVDTIPSVNNLKSVDAFVSKSHRKMCIQSPGQGFYTSDGWPTTFKTRGPSTDRPTTLTADEDGFEFYDTTIHLLIHWDGTQWVDAVGNIV